MSIASTLASDRPLKVLTPDLSGRLAIVNDARRALLDRGYRIEKQDLNLGLAKRPLLQLEHGDERLRRDLRKVVMGEIGGVRCVTGQFMEVDVTWRWPLPSAVASP